jgi:predicted membrane protein
MEVKKHNRNHVRFWGILLIVFGSLFFFEGIGLFDIGNFIGTFWPAILIIIGLWVIVKAKGSAQANEVRSQYTTIGDQEESSPSDTVAMSSVFGDVRMTIGSKNFQGGHISTVFGDVVVDLSSLEIAAGEKELMLHNVFGDIRIKPPEHVVFALQGNAVAGDINILEKKQNGLFPKLDYTSQGFTHASKRLRIYASHVFGDIKVRTHEH